MAGSVSFVTICVDDSPAVARKLAPTRWPNLAHYWIDSSGVAEAAVTFVPNRAVVCGRDGMVARWWDGTEGLVLKGPHGASRTNGSRGLLLELLRSLEHLGEPPEATCAS